MAYPTKYVVPVLFGVMVDGVVRPVPIMRQKDHVGEKADNTASFQKLIEVPLAKELFVVNGRRWKKGMQ